MPYISTQEGSRTTRVLFALSVVISFSTSTRLFLGGSLKKAPIIVALPSFALPRPYYSYRHNHLGLTCQSIVVAVAVVVFFVVCFGRMKRT